MIASDPPGKLTRTDFLAALKASGLEALPAVRHALAAYAGRVNTPEELARAMVAANALTKFQADRLLAGKTDGFVIGRYVVLDQAGAGPIARVYRAWHTTMDRLVALKVLAAAVTRDPDRRAAFVTEARAAAALAHPNVVTVLDVNQTGRRLYVVMEYVDGAGADALVRRGGPLAVGRACDVVRQAALGVQHAHDKGIPHGAIYPGCVLVGPAAVKVSGFGLGRLTDPAATAQTATDPIDYRAPEQFSPLAKPTPTADVYSLGCLLTYLLTGRPPFPAGSPPDKARQHQTAGPAGVELARHDVPPELAALVRALLAKDPAARPSAADVAAALGPWSGPDDVTTHVEICPVTGPAADGSLSGPLTHPAARPEDETFPWAGFGGPLAEETVGITPGPAATRRTGGPGSGLAFVLALTGAVCVGAAFAVLMVMRHFK